MLYKINALNIAASSDTEPNPKQSEKAAQSQKKNSIKRMYTKIGSTGVNEIKMITKKYIKKQN